MVASIYAFCLFHWPRVVAALIVNFGGCDDQEGGGDLWITIGDGFQWDLPIFLPHFTKLVMSTYSGLVVWLLVSLSEILWSPRAWFSLVSVNIYIKLQSKVVAGCSVALVVQLYNLLADLVQPELTHTSVRCPFGGFQMPSLTITLYIGCLNPMPLVFILLPGRLTCRVSTFLF